MEHSTLKDVVDQLEAVEGELDELTILPGQLREEEDPQALKELGSRIPALDMITIVGNRRRISPNRRPLMSTRSWTARSSRSSMRFF